MTLVCKQRNVHFFTSFACKDQLGTYYICTVGMYCIGGVVPVFCINHVTYIYVLETVFLCTIGKL